MTIVDLLAGIKPEDLEAVPVVVVRPCWICRKPATHGNECESCNDTSIAIDKAHERREQ